ncbi:hypothetical protein GCM10007071_27350 [Marinobacter zhanjiangensis]|uniref:Uncharacterized protein n=1 Tax=Marinobacter zhanjiangensis TaxID=578215 RepID=A0ABQ3B8E8_9GAMM|nr:hypothetical protein GCM10007071_27350 [Marinobacter zhanjiangensis]
MAPGGGNTTKIKGIINHWHEEVRGTDDAHTIANIRHGGVVAAIVADQQTGITEFWLAGVENPVQNIRCNLATTAGAMAEFGQSDRQGSALSHGKRKERSLADNADRVPWFLSIRPEQLRPTY